MRSLAVVVTVCLLATSNAFAGGELPVQKGQPRGVPQEAVEAVEHNVMMTRALHQSMAAAIEAGQRESTKHARATRPVTHTPDAFGDPMYGHYGARAYVGSPNYAGPSYAASFSPGDRFYLPDSEYRGYYRGVYSHPQMYQRTDAGLGAGASWSYMQHGMLMAPGTQAPSGARAIINNSRY